MERVRKVILGNNSRSLDLTPVLPPYCIMILASAEDVRPRIHEYRKQLEKGASLFSSSWSKFDSGGLCANCPLWSLMKTQEDLVNAQRKFQDESVKQLIGSLKTWEEECSLLLKSKVELHRAFMDMNKVRDKQRSGKDNENVKSLIAFTESTYNLQKETLFKDLSRYLQSESSHQAEIKKFLEEQLKFLDFCRKEADCILSTTSSPSALPGDAPKQSHFGSSLEDHLDDQGYSLVLKRCLSYLTKKEAYTKEGIFRVAGQVTYINLLRTAFDQNKVDDELLDLCGVYVVADVMKQYLRELPEPLLSKAFTDNLSSKLPSSDKLISLMNTQLSPPNRKNLLLLLKFLLKVVKHEETSKMSVENLALTLWINLCPTSAITEGISVVTNLLAQAEDLVSGEDNSDATELPSHATAVAAPLRAVQTVCKPQPPDRTYGTRSSGLPGSQKLRPPPPPPPFAPNYSPQVSVNDARNLSATNPQSNSVGSVQYQQQHSASVPVTTFDTSSFRRTSSALAPNEEKGISTTPSTLSSTSTPPLSFSGTSTEHERSKPSLSDSEMPRHEDRSSRPTSLPGDKAREQEKEDAEGNEESEKSTSENSVSTDTSTTDSSTEVVSEHKHKSKTRSDEGKLKKKKEVKEERSEKSPSVHSEKKEANEVKGKADLKMRSHGTDTRVSSETLPKKVDCSETKSEFLALKENMDQKRASSASVLGSKKNTSNVGTDGVKSQRETRM